MREIVLYYDDHVDDECAGQRLFFYEIEGIRTAWMGKQMIQKTTVKEEELAAIRQCIEGIRFGSINIVVQDGRIVQIEKHEKLRLDQQKSKKK